MENSWFPRVPLCRQVRVEQYRTLRIETQISVFDCVRFALVVKLSGIVRSIQQEIGDLKHTCAQSSPMLIVSLIEEHRADPIN